MYGTQNIGHYAVMISEHITALCGYTLQRNDFQTIALCRNPLQRNDFQALEQLF